jgi:cupin fold WbuC family metalloprotein
MSAPNALSPPSGAAVVLGEEHVQEALAASRASQRKRTILPFHKHDGELLHRMFNALQPGTYAAPHRHSTSGKNEAFIVLRGALDFIVFSEDGAIDLAVRLCAGGPRFGIDLAPSCFHSFLVREPDTLVYEVKQGPYSPLDDKDFAPWAPREGSDGVDAYLERLERELKAFAATDAKQR